MRGEDKPGVPHADKLDDDLLKKADMALYGKREGRNCYRNYGGLKEAPSPPGRGPG